MEDDPALLTSSDLERCLEHVQATAAGPHEGVFGPASALWHVDREAFCLSAQAGHSSCNSRILGSRRQYQRTRMRSTIRSDASTALSGSSSHWSSVHPIRRSRRLGVSIVSTPLCEDRCRSGSGHMRKAPPLRKRGVSPPIGSRDPRGHSACRYELVRPPLPPECASAPMGRAGGLVLSSGSHLTHSRSMPRRSQLYGLDAFIRALAVGADARRIGARVLSGAGRVWVPGWYRDLTAALFRSPCDPPSSFHSESRAAPGNTGDKSDPASIPGAADAPSNRAPYQGALARVFGRHQPDLVTRTLNRL